MHYQCINKKLDNCLDICEKDYDSWKDKFEEVFNMHGKGLFVFMEMEDGIHMFYHHDKKILDSLPKEFNPERECIISVVKWDNLFKKRIGKRRIIQRKI